MRSLSTDPAKPALFGISRSNRDFADPYYWGKNQFNSAFPVALACYMRAHAHPAVYVTFKSARATNISEIDIGQLFGTNAPNEELFFAFETRYEAFRQCVNDELPTIDLVVSHLTREKQLVPLEIKLTTLPDNTTEGLDESKYGTELVIRSATTRYMAKSMSNSVEAIRKNARVRDLFEPVFGKIRAWDSKVEMLQVATQAVTALEQFLNEFKSLQRPLLVQPIWKTVGKTPQLANHCLDIFAWSDFALAHLFLDSARNAVEGPDISRQLRAALRLARFLYERARSASGKVFQAPIYDGMTYDKQNDKEFAISGTKTHGLMTCERLTKPLIHKDQIKEIILGGGQKFLSPERRFDAILYFSTDLFPKGTV